MKNKIYFAHPVNTYGTPLEEMMIIIIQETFPGFVIENPNQEKHRIGYAKWKEKYENHVVKSGMNYFYDEVLADCEAGTVAMPFADMRFGAGVASETIYTIKKDRNVYLIETPNLDNIRDFTEVEIGTMLQWEKVRDSATSKEERDAVENKLVLSIAHTRLRTWTEYMVTKRPYEDAHLV
ncbi:hypothetical protein ACFLZC_02790 [Patescibacteria group bacterium]